MLERRLDNVIFSPGFSPTVIAACQLVSHRHVALNGKSVNIPSIRVKLGDKIALKVTSLKIAMVIETLARPVLDRPEWLTWDDAEKVVKVAHLPDAGQVPFPIDV